MDNKLCRIIGLALGLIAFNCHAEDAPAAKTDKPATEPMSMNTNVFLDQGTLPVLYTCDGKDVSPQLTWANLPAKTQSLAIIMSDNDVDNGQFYHWVIFNIAKNVDNFAEGMKNAPSGATIGLNSYNKQQYNGPCPPKGGAHTYTFKLFALDSKLTLPNNADGAAVIKAMEKHTIAKAELSTTYSRWINA